MTLEDHIKMQQQVANRLRESGYTRIYQNKEYKITRNGHTFHGEVDILALSPRGYWRFYEIKSCPKKLAVAQSQYDRFRNAFPSRNIKGVFVSYGKVKRLYH
jgi:Holliday junction resolvase-like predicted endonuclease